jgi:hypothetical protein
MHLNSKVHLLGLVASWVVGTVGGRAAAGLDAALSRAVPSDAIAALMMDAAAGTEQAGGLSPLELARMASDGGQRLGLLSPIDDSVRCWIDSLAALSVALRYRLAVTLLDVGARRRPDGGHELSMLSAALAVDTGGDHAAVEQRVAHLLRAYTNSEASTVETRTDGGRTWYVLRDRRLPAWAEITWGSIGESYLVTIGAGSRDRASRALSGDGGTLHDDRWFAAAFDRAGGAGARAVVYTDLRQLEAHADSALRTKVGDATAALGLADASRTLFAFARDNRSVEIRAVARIGATDDLRLLAGKRIARESGAQIPSRATGYAAIRWEPIGALRGACSAYLSARSPGARDRARWFWSTLEREAGVSIEQDVFAHLGSVILIHNYPEHALRLPMAWTIVVSIEDEAETVRRSLVQLLGHVSHELIPQGSAVQLLRSPDAMWYLSFGLTGPAITVTDHHLVVSFSPEAVQRNLDALRVNPQVD